MDDKTFYSLEVATKQAADLEKDDKDGWAYVVVDCENGLAYIEVWAGANWAGYL